MVYSPQKIKLLTLALSGNKEVFKKLREEAPEFAALGAALVGNVNAMNWLLKHEKTLALFVEAVDNNKTAVKVLLLEKQPELAAVANMLNDDEDAELWLEKHNMKLYLDFAVAIQHALDNENRDDLGPYFKLYG